LSHFHVTASVITHALKPGASTRVHLIPARNVETPGVSMRRLRRASAAEGCPTTEDRRPTTQLTSLAEFHTIKDQNHDSRISIYVLYLRRLLVYG
jgi:hypothetical protein